MNKKEQTKKVLEGLTYGDVIKYKTKHGDFTYLIVKSNENGEISGQMASQ